MINKEHPEIKEGEMFLANTDEEGYVQIGWATKRKGMVAYDIDGETIKPLTPFFPVFVQKFEYDMFEYDIGMRPSNTQIQEQREEEWISLVQNMVDSGYDKEGAIRQAGPPPREGMEKEI